MLLSIATCVTPFSLPSSFQNSRRIAQRRTPRLAGFVTLTLMLAAGVALTDPGVLAQATSQTLKRHVRPVVSSGEAKRAAPLESAAFGAGVGTLVPRLLAFVNQVVRTNAGLSASVTKTGSAAISSALFRGMKKGAQDGI
jgi:hypothetical protein